ncbi:MAG: hypothetical protein HY097_10020 [Nitrospinae bacterium]|nr:hypothetical protein [Nitrospinota bacterium]
MRKIILIAVFTLILSLPSPGRAATVGNSADTLGESWKFSLGLDYDMVFNRDLDNPDTSANDDIKIKSNRLFLKGAVGVHPNIDLFLKLGMADAKIESISGADKYEYDGGMKFGFGLGAKVKIFEPMPGFRVMGDVQYLTYEVDNTVKVNGSDLKNSGVSSYTSNTKVTETQLALYVNQTIERLSPYLGVKYSKLDGDVETNMTLSSGTRSVAKGKAGADNNFGIFAGTDIFIIPKQLSATIEGRFLDETAGTIGIRYLF